jgi:alginate O-acetyltransferase complex protein AlgI
MFPQLIAGPIVRYHDVAQQLERRSYSVDQIAEGGRRFVYGLAKKVLLANMLGELCEAYRMAEESSVAFCWLYAAAFTLQIYYDFSGYSDMAIGLGRILGFDFMENFRYPLTAKSITEFWRRWHISLGSWFRDYVYIPLGGSRVKPFRVYCNILIVWMLTGLWHGAAWNFVLWGLYFALLLLIEKHFLLDYMKDKAVLSHIYVIFAVTISFVLFNGETLSQAAGDLAGMFGLAALPLMTGETLYYLSGYGLILIAALIGATPAVTMVARKLKGRAGWAEPLLLVCLLILITACLIDGSFNPFLYFRF